MPRQLDSIQPAAATVAADAEPLPDQQQIVEWLARLGLLNGVPFNYLVPDESMLPTESIRFFQVDAAWLVALLDGAFSLGFAGVTEATAEAARPGLMDAARTRSRELRAGIVGAEAPGDGEPQPMSGFLLRSFVVAGWPGLEVGGFSDAAGQHALTLLRMERLGTSVLLCLFAGVLARADLTEPAEGLRSGVDGTANWTKGLRYATATGGHAIGDPVGGTPVAVPVRSGRVLDMAGLARTMAQTITPFTPAQFAVELCQGAATVSFVAGATG